MPNALIDPLIEELQTKTGHEADTSDAVLKNLLKRSLIAFKISLEQLCERMNKIEERQNYNDTNNGNYGQ